MRMSSTVREDKLYIHNGAIVDEAYYLKRVRIVCILFKLGIVSKKTALAYLASFRLFFV